jgi:3-oxoacyl-[acyl-carrier-protein] synthase III
MGVRFTGWGIGLPEKIVTNDDLSKTLDTSDEWISERTGIRERRIGSSTRELGVLAATEAMRNAGVSPSDIDVLILATTTPDCMAMDLNAACSGFMYGVRTAQGLLETGAKRILLIGAEHLSGWVDWSDRNTAVLLGDGGGAAVLEYDENVNEILSFVLGSDGASADILTAPHEGFFYMDGPEVFRRAVRVVVDSAEKAMALAGVSAEQISLVVPHQANIRIIQAVCQRLGIDMERAVITLDRYGNTSSASIPLAYYDALKNGRVKSGEYALMTGFGAGMTWASAVMKWA